MHPHGIAFIGRDDVILAIPTKPRNAVRLVHAIDRPVLDVDACGVGLGGEGGGEEKNQVLQIVIARRKAAHSYADFLN